MSVISKIASCGAVAILAIGMGHAALAVDVPSDAGFMRYVQETNEFAIESSRMALERSDSKAIQGYAIRVIIERGDIAEELSVVRRDAGVKYAPTSSDRRHLRRAVLDRLAALEGGGFDDAYASAQLADQVEAVALVDAYSRNGADDKLRRFARNILPKLEAQLDYAKRIAKE